MGDTQTEYDPTGHFLVCCLGNYEGPEAQRPTKVMMRSLTLAARVGGAALGHQPGHDVRSSRPRLDELPRPAAVPAAAAVARAGGRAGRVEYDPITGRAGRRLVRAIEQG